MQVFVMIVVLAAAALALDTPARADSSFAGIQKGRYLVAAGDCAACHTADDGKPFAGGRAVPTPFGTIYATNITPDAATGIGDWTEEDFYRALHEGIRRDGQHLYPAFPYPWYTRLTRDDVHAIYEYLRSIDPVREANKAPDLPWPLSWRPMMAVWNALFFKPGTFHADAQRSAQWNRGAYLVEGYGHCAACHAPKNFLGAVKHDAALSGGYGEKWFAPSLTGDQRAGLGAWSQADLVQYLKTGANARAAASGPMAEVVEHSTQALSDADLAAVATYLKSFTTGEGTTAAVDDRDVLARGGAVYADQCVGCHMPDGKGQAGVFPPMAGNSAVQAKDAADVIRVILDGTREAATTHKPTAFAMPAFGWKLTDQDVADVAAYIRNAWGNRAGAVASSAVHDLRQQVRQASSQ